ncbi:MAG: hypothetical protein IJD99_09835, partial [Clostridia bacterium]|nr:hypothetical protein [Clostridia bacterium]
APGLIIPDIEQIGKNEPKCLQLGLEHGRFLPMGTYIFEGIVAYPARKYKTENRLFPQKNRCGMRPHHSG